MRPLDPKELTAGISKVLEEQIAKIIEEEAKKAAAETERRVRESVGVVISRVSEYFSYERFGRDLRITVRFPHGDDPAQE